MAATVTRDQVLRLQAEGAVVIEVLPEEEYGLEHVAGALHVPLDDVGPGLRERFRADQPIVVYCNDFL